MRSPVRSRSGPPTFQPSAACILLRAPSVWCIT